MGENRLGEPVTQTDRVLGDELARALNLLGAEMLTPPLSFISQPGPLHPKASAAINAGSGAALQPEDIEIAHFVRGDWESSLRPLQHAVGRVCEVAGANRLATAFGRFKSILQQLAAAVHRHDDDVKITAGGYHRDGPPQEGGPFEGNKDKFRSAKRAWMLKSQGPDVLGTTFVHYRGSARKDLRAAWLALVAAADTVSELKDNRKGQARQTLVADSWTEVSVLIKGPTVSISAGKRGARLSGLRVPPRVFKALSCIAMLSGGSDDRCRLEQQSKSGMTTKAAKVAQAVRKWLRSHIRASGDPLIASGEGGLYRPLFVVKQVD